MKKQMMIVVLLIFGSVSFIYSLDLEKKQYDIGFTACLWMGGTVNIGGYEGEKKSSVLLRGFADAYLIPKLAMGAYVNFSPYTQEGVDINIFEFGASIKPKFFIEEDIAIKPGLNLGYRTGSSNPEGLEMDGLGVNLSIEIQKVIDTKILSFEGGFLSQPAGGSKWFEITWAPIVYAGAGLTF